MIYKKNADNIVNASAHVTEQLLKENLPSRPVIIKPNIVNPSLSPVTTDARVVEGIIRALREHDIHDIVVAEGSGTGDTLDNFNRLGFSGLGVRLIDLDKEATVTLPVKNHLVWNEITIPKIVLDTCIISVPVLKEHSMCGVTISLKNMVGILSAQRYAGYWTYKKSEIHRHNTDECIADIISVIKPDLAVVDATVGMKGSHLSGTPCDPPIHLVYGSTDPLEADKFGCDLLKRNWREIKHLKIIDGKTHSPCL
ncbi:MAG: DUF362 domain-containing protein [Nitrospiraceae bacterium]|nr:MAG: DUF362 domain-containing protein [Nitrospiraceae bacterium]